MYLMVECHSKNDVAIDRFESRGELLVQCKKILGVIFSIP